MRELGYTIEIADMRLSTIWYDNQFNISESTVDNNPSKDFRATHTHASYEIFFVTKGKLWLTTEDKSFLCENSLVLVPPSTPHYTITENAVISVIFFSVERHGEEQKNSLYDRFVEKVSKSPVQLEINDDIAYFISRIAKERDSTQRTYELLSHLVSALFLDIIYGIVPLRSSAPKHPPTYYDQKINRFLIGRYNQKICRKDLANALFLSEKQTSRIIQNRFGCSFNELVMRWRLNVACMYLTQTSMEIYEIASSVGYEYPNLFFSHFKKAYKMTPAEYRQSNQKSN